MSEQRVMSRLSSECHILTFEDRRTISSVVNILKILNGDLKSKFTEVLTSALYQPQHGTRRPNIFDVSKIKIHRRSPISIGNHRTNELRDIINIQDSVATNKLKLKNHLLTVRREPELQGSLRTT